MINKLKRRLEEIGAPDDVKMLAADLFDQALRDSLTGLYNRRYFDESLRNQIEAARRYGRELSLLLFDLDRFKEINDTCGHPAGDAVLQQFAVFLQNSVRKADIVCRIGGDEFAAILPETSLSNAWDLQERFFQTSLSAGIQASAGIAALPSDDLYADADRELLASKPRVR